MARSISSREFNQHVSRAKAAAETGPVYITDRGKPAHVLMSYADYERLVGAQTIAEWLGEPAGIADVDLEIPVMADQPRPADVE